MCILLPLNVPKVSPYRTRPHFGNPVFCIKSDLYTEIGSRSSSLFASLLLPVYETEIGRFFVATFSPFFVRGKAMAKKTADFI
jgi:hypothetical protein